jgi:YidC/Oxa1 family membrane protein insertase
MNTGRFLLAIILTIAVIIITNLLFPPVPPPAVTPADTVAPGEPGAPPAIRPAPDSPATAPVPAPAPGAPLPQRAGVDPAAAEAVAPADTVPVAGPIYRYGFSTRGAGLVRAEILGHASYTRDGPVDLVPPGPHPLVSYRVQLAGGEIIDLRDVLFEVEPADGLRLADDGQPGTLTFRHADEGGRFGVELVYTFDPGSFLVDVAGRFVGAIDEAARLLMDMGPTLPVHEANPAEDHRALSYVVNNRRTGIRSQRLDRVGLERIEEGPLSWVALKNKYFLAAAIGAGEGRYFGGLIARQAPGDHAAHLTSTLPVAPDNTVRFGLYVGPQEAKRLRAIGDDFENVNPYGWRIFRPIIRPVAHFVTWALVGMHNVLGLGYGWVLILFGVLIRVVLWPLNAHAGRAQLKNMEVQPKLKEIQTRYKNEPEKLQKEMMRLYKEEGFNPFGGCLPLLVPFPVLITLFFVFQSTIEFRGVEFLWLPDLSRPDPLYILPVVLGASMFLMQWISLKSMPMPNPQMKMMMWFMPIFMVVIFLNLASGLNLYYSAQNLASVPQQLQLRNERLRAQAAKKT